MRGTYVGFFLVRKRMGKIQVPSPYMYMLCSRMNPPTLDEIADRSLRRRSVPDRELSRCWYASAGAWGKGPTSNSNVLLEQAQPSPSSVVHSPRVVLRNSHFVSDFSLAQRRRKKRDRGT